MRHGLALTMLLTAGCGADASPPIPLTSGKHEFQHRFAEHPSIPSISLDATIDGRKIVLVNPKASGPFAAGIIAEGELMWHSGSGQWIIGQAADDVFLRDVGGCSDGPEVIDLASKVYWTC